MNILTRLWRWFEFPHRLIAAQQVLATSGSSLLDVGCGNHSPTLTKKYFPQCIYHGLDSGRWNRDRTDDSAMDHFHGIDLEKPEQLDILDNGRYDAIICSHVLEHLSYPYAVAEKLVQKLKPNGLLYVEVPSERSLKLPRAANGWYGIRGCLNFYDDSTHKTMIDLDELRRVLQQQGCEVTVPRYRFLWRRFLCLPLYAATGIALRGYIPASVVWDIAGFAKYVIARKTTDRLLVGRKRRLAWNRASSEG